MIKFYLKQFLCAAAVLGAVGVWSSSYAQYVVDFEGASETKGSYASGTVTLSGIDWNMTEALIGTLSGDWKNGNRSLRLRGRNGSAASMIANKANGIGILSFSYRRYNTDGAQQPWAVEYSTNNGSSWTQIGLNITGTATVQTFNQTVNVTGNIRIRFRLTSTPGTSGNRRLNIDDITITDFLGTPTCSLSSLGLANITCNDNGTPADASDDITSFELNPTGSDLGANYSVDMDGFTDISTSPSGPWTSDVVSGISYGSSTTFYLEPGSAGIGGDLDVIVIDGTDNSCFEFETITDPGSCSAGGGGSTCLYEDFETLSLGGYTSGNFTVSGETWSGIQVFQESATASIGNRAIRINDDVANANLTTPSVDAPQSITFQYRELNSGGGTFDVQKSVGGGPFITVCSQSFSGTTFTPNTCAINESSNNVRIRILSDDNAGHLIVDNVEIICGSSAPAPELQLIDASANNQACGALTLDFGTLTPFSTADLTFDIANVGTLDLDVSGITGLSGTDFSILSPATPFTVTAGGSQTVTVGYTANATTGAVSEILTIISNDDDEGTCTVDLVGESSNAIPIPDNGCPSNDVASTFVYSGGSPIADVDIFVAVTHTYRSDLRIDVESPAGTVVQLFDGSNSGSEDNLEVIFDDDGSAITSNSHTINGTADETVTSDADLLAAFNGENPNGTWTLRICDAAGGDLGSLEAWYPIIQIATINPEPSSHVTGFDCTTSSSSEMLLTWVDATGPNLPSAYLISWSDVDYASIPTPTDATPVADGSNALNVNQGVETATITGLTQGTQYYFKIFPYSNSGSNIDYKTDGIVPGSDCETEDGPCEFESFENTTASTSTGYNSGSYSGDNGETWTFAESQEAQARGYGIDGKGLILRRESSSSSISTTFSNGISGFSCRLRKAYTGSGNRQVELFINGVSYGSSITFGGSSGADATIVPFNVSNIDIAGSGTIEIRNITNNQVTIDDISWSCYDGCTPTHSIASFLPTSGPAGTRVTITGSGFTGATGVSFNESNALAFEVVDDNTIIAQVPEGQNNGAIRIAVDGCEATSSTQFTFLTDNDNCGSGGGGAATDLFISEVYDSDGGSLSYIEVFNGTLGTVNLGGGNYSIRIRTGTSTDNDFAMSGNLASGATYVLRLGSDAPICSGLSVQNNQPSAGGFNGNDQIFLRKNNADLDYVPNPNHPNAGGTGSNFTGFSQIRKSTVTSPTTTYNAGEWDEFGTESCSDLGSPPYLPSGNDITISAQPADVDCSTLTFSVSATSTSGFPGTGAYTWRYNAPGTDTWELVSSLNGSNGITVTGSNTPSITIAGNTAALIDYQFYADIGASGSPQCRRYSNAAYYTYDTRTYYRTRSGANNYTDLSSWEMSDTEGSGYVTSVCQYPVAANSEKVIISNGHEVNLSGLALELDWLVVEAGGKFNMNDNSLTLYDGNVAGADLDIQGEFTDRATSGGSNGMNFSSGATWQMGANGTVVKTNTSSVNNYRDNYEGGIATIPATANWIFRREADNDVAVSTVNMYYPNLTFENNVAGNYSPGATVYFFSGNTGGTAVIKGDLDIGGSGIGTYKMVNQNFNQDPIRVEGDLIIQSGSSMTNSHPGTNDGTGLEVLGDLVIEGGLSLGASGTSPQRGQLRLTGNSDQIIAGSGSTLINVNRLLIDKPGGDILSDAAITVNENVELVRGILEFDDSTYDAFLQLNNSATHSGASINSFVHGRVRKVGFTANTLFEFPVGYYDVFALPAVQVYQPAALTPQTTSSTAAFEVQYFHENYTPGFENPNAPPPRDGSLTAGSVSTCNYWNIDRIQPGTNARVRLSWDTDECLNIDDPDLLVVARWEDAEGVEEWQNTSDLQPSPTNSGAGVEGWVETGHFVSNFSPFAVGSQGFSLNILPITLLSFTAEAVDNRLAECRWVTASEINNDYFTIERTRDGASWEAVGTVPGAGNSNTALDYTFVDDDPHPGLSYYRLRQTDFDGTTEVTEPRAVRITDGNDEFALHSVYRTETGVRCTYTAYAPYLTVEIFDLTGKRVFGTVEERNGTLTDLDVNLARGVYLLRLSDNRHSASLRFFY